MTLRTLIGKLSRWRRGAERPPLDLAEVRREEQEVPRQVRELLHGTQIRTVYQPIGDLRTGHAKGWEALSRGPSGTHLHNPLEMFAAAKDFVFELDRHCCSLALKSARGLPKDAKLFINILPSSICNPSLLEVLEGQGIGAERIVLEISERLDIPNYPYFCDTLRSLTDRGFEVAMDNMGIWAIRIRCG